MLVPLVPPPLHLSPSFLGIQCSPLLLITQQIEHSLQSSFSPQSKSDVTPFPPMKTDHSSLSPRNSNISPFSLPKWRTPLSLPQDRRVLLPNALPSWTPCTHPPHPTWILPPKMHRDACCPLHSLEYIPLPHGSLFICKLQPWMLQRNSAICSPLLSSLANRRSSKERLPKFSQYPFNSTGKAEQTSKHHLRS